jgi:hypothetical protein
VNAVFLGGDADAPTIEDNVALDDERKDAIEKDVEKGGEPHPEVFKDDALDLVTIGDPTPCMRVSFLFTWKMRRVAYVHRWVSP